MHFTPCQLVNSYKHQDKHNASIFRIQQSNKRSNTRKYVYNIQVKLNGRAKQQQQCHTVYSHKWIMTELEGPASVWKESDNDFQDIMHTKKQHDEKKCCGMQLVVLGWTRKAEIMDTFHPGKGGTLQRNTF
jgi:hypothetical protein